MDATAEQIESSPLYYFQAEAIYLLMFRSGVYNVPAGFGKGVKRVDMDGLPSAPSPSVGREHALFALWLCYQLVTNSKKPVSKTDFVFKLKEFNVESETVDTALKALVNVFGVFNQFTFNNDKKCKPRFSTNNKDQEIMINWCRHYESNNPDVIALADKLKLG